MVTSRWQKRNNSRFNLAFFVLLFSILLIGWPASALNLEGWLALLISFIAVICGGMLAFLLVKRDANVMVRVLKFSYDEIERELRKLLKDNHIQFSRKTIEEGYQYELIGYNLTMTVQPYFLHNWHFYRARNPQPASQVTVGELNANNEAFAEKLATLIDEMVIQRKHSWEF